MGAARLIVLLLGVVALCEASPARMFFNAARRNSPSLETIATVDCSNREAVRFVAKTNANFRCVYPDHSYRTSAVRDRSNEPLLFNNAAADCAPGQVFDEQLRVCTFPRPAGLQSASLTREDPSKCAPGTMFVSEIGLCLEANKPQHIAPLESDSLIVEQPKDEISSFSSSSSHVASDCQPGEIYNSELSLCMTANKVKSDELLPALNLVKESEAIAPLEIEAFASSISSAADCKDGEMYVYEIGTCVEINPSPPLETASLVRDRVTRTPSKKPITVKDCTDYEIYVSEIGICMPINPPTDKRPLVSDSLVQEQSPARPVAVPDTQSSCDDDELYVPEIGICVPLDRSRKPSRPSSSSLVREPEKLEIQAFKTSLNYDECEPGTHFVPEIGMCLN